MSCFIKKLDDGRGPEMEMMSVILIPLSEPFRFEFNKHVVFQETTYKELSQA